MLPSDDVRVRLKWFGGFFFYPEEALIDPVYFEEYFDTNSLNFEQYKVYMKDAIDFMKSFDFDIMQYDKIVQLQNDDRVAYDKAMFNLKKHLISCEFLSDRYKSKIYNYETTNYIDRVSQYPMPKYIKWFQVDCESEKVDWNKIPSSAKQKIVYDALVGESDNMSGEVTFETTYRMAKRFNPFCAFPMVKKKVTNADATKSKTVAPVVTNESKEPVKGEPEKHDDEGIEFDTDKIAENVSDGLDLLEDDDPIVPFVKPLENSGTRAFTK